MSRPISPEHQDELLETLLHEQRVRFVRFYSKNRELFTQREEDEAFKYFDAVEEDLTPQELYQRREACLNNLHSAENFAQRTKAREQELRKEVQSRLGALPIAFDTKKKLLDEFFASDLKGKEAVLKAVEKEEFRVAEKRKGQHKTIENKQAEYRSLLESTEFQTYFSAADREFAWESLLAVLASLKTNAARISRIQIFIDTIPSSLAYAKEQDENYQKLLKVKILEPEKRKLMLAQFREQSCLVKTSLLSNLQEQAAEQKEEQVEEKEADSEENNKDSKLEQQKLARIKEYSEYYSQFAHSETPEQFAELDSDEQNEILKQRKIQHPEEVTLLTIYSSLDTKDDQDKSIRLAQFKKKTLAEKKAYIDSFIAQVPDDPDASNIRGIELIKIVAEILRNKNRVVFASDQERIKLVHERIKAKRLSVHFGPHHFSSIKAILADFDEERWEQPQTLSLAEKRLREREYVG